MSTITLRAPDISCSHCAMTIQRELKPVEGITAVRVDVAAKTVTFDYADEAALQRAKALMREIGYPVVQG
ncbi:MAG: heavy-metal-associated domain-containing protein [Chloroflexota bacterium]